MGAAALTIAAGLLTVLDSGAAFAKKEKGSAPSGTVSCSKVTGSVTFDPPLTASGGSSSETTKVKVTVSDCTASSGVTVTKGTGTSSSSSSSNACTSLESPPTSPESFLVKWSPKSDGSTAVSYTGRTTVTSSSGDAGFELTGGTSSGSFAATGVTATSYTNETTAQITSMCTSKSGLKKLDITSGSTSG